MKTKSLSLFFLSILTASINAGAVSKTFVYCSEGSPSTFNPQQATDGTTFNASSHTIYNRLIEFKSGSTEIAPALAKSWKISKDGLVYTFKLRSDVKFHSNEFFKPTRNFNADDVVYSFEVQKDKNHPLGQKNAVYEYYTSMDMANLIKSVRKISEDTVEFNLTKPEAPFLANMAMDFASILSLEYAQQLQKANKPMTTMNTNPIGTGPFVFKSYQKDTIIRFSRNENYFAARPGVDQLVFAITPDASVRFQKLKAGECQLVADPAPQDLVAIGQTPALKLMEQNGLNVGYLAFNVEKKPFDNLKVRKAIQHALNKKLYIEAIYLGRAQVAKNPLPPTIWSYNGKTPEDAYDPELAKKLLNEAGLEKGFDTELWTMPVSRPYNPAGKKMGEMMQADLAKVGIRAKLVTFDWPTYLDKARKGEHQMLQIGWTGDNGDPDNFLHVLLGCAAVKGGSNYARWCNKEFNDLVEKAKLVTDIKKRTELYKKAQLVFHEQAPWAPLAHAKMYRAMAKGVTGYQIHPFGGDIFHDVDLK
jgi:dipeptide transport system substrate-binding protein